MMKNCCCNFICSFFCVTAFFFALACCCCCSGPKEEEDGAAADGIINLDAHQPSHISHTPIFLVFFWFTKISFFSFPSTISRGGVHLYTRGEEKKMMKNAEPLSAMSGARARCITTLAHPQTLFFLFFVRRWKERRRRK